MKPYPEFPLSAHTVGQCVKKIKGKVWYFGVWANPEDAFRKYLDQVDEIQAGRDLRKTGVAQVFSDALSVYDLLNMFLERQQGRASTSQVKSNSFAEHLT